MKKNYKNEKIFSTRRRNELKTLTEEFLDKDWKEIDGIKEGLYQYYDIEKTTDLFSLNTGKVMAKIGANENIMMPNKTDVTFIIIDNKPHLTENGIKYLDLIYSDMIEALHQKPDEIDIEAIRLYMDNIWRVFNRTVFRVTEIKNSLQKNQKLIHETWNPPA